MRPIKFRAWANEKSERYKPNTMWSWKEIWDNTYNEIPGKTILHYGLNPEISGIELMQYTGLKDRNGKEIYESDIIQYSSTTCWVDFYAGCFVLKCKGQESWYGIGSLGAPVDNYEVIGNIYQNPELLK
jgi:uncharacterized phage protein (TIGR01671 family)